jgi:hypothetical protein
MEIHGQDQCPHSGFYSGIGFYSQESQMLRYVLVCDECGEEMKEIHAQDYAPDPILQPAI